MLTKLQITNPAIDLLKQWIDYTHANGGMLIECFQVHDMELLEREDGLIDVEKVLTTEAVKRLFSEGTRFDTEIEFEWVSPFCLEGEIATCLYNGGAYNSFVGVAMKAKKIAQDFCEAIFANRYDDIEVYHNREPWCSWFYDVAWDNTWIVLDEETERIWLICATDTD